MAEKLFYVYALYRPDGTIFYVGKGKGNRLYDHEEATKGGSRTATANVIREIWASGAQVKKKILFESDREEEVLREEQQRIAQYDNGQLTNRRLRSRHVEWINHQPHRRYEDGRVIDFPAGSNWRDLWNELRALALRREVTMGTLLLEAMRRYLTDEWQEPPEPKPKKGDSTLPLGATVRLSKNKK